MNLHFDIFLKLRVYCTTSTDYIYVPKSYANTKAYIKLGICLAKARIYKVYSKMKKMLNMFKFLSLTPPRFWQIR